MPQDNYAELLESLKSRFEKNMNRHKDIVWENVETKLESQTDKLKSLEKMEQSGGEPDVISYDKNKNEYIFCDCSEETPKERRNLCYDKKARESRKKFSPKSSATEIAHEMGIEILDQEEYENLQSLGEFDKKTSSWIKTPDAIRNLGGALFADRRYDHVFIYHNGADSYYSGRGFRGLLRV